MYAECIYLPPGWNLRKGGADGEIRTPTDCSIRPSSARVYQFHHIGTFSYSDALFAVIGRRLGLLDGHGLLGALHDGMGFFFGRHGRQR